MAEGLAIYFEEIGNQIWKELNAAFRDETWLDWKGLPDDALQSMTAKVAELYLLGQGLRGFADSCFSLASTIRSRADLIAHNSNALAHYERAAEFADRWAEKHLSEFRAAKESNKND